MTEQRRRRNDYNPEDSFIKKMEKSKAVDIALRIVMTLALGGGAGFAVTERKETQTTQAVGDVSNMKLDLELFRKDYAEFRQRNRERNAEREIEMGKLRDRILILETIQARLESQVRRRN